MISVKQAEKIVLDNTKNFGAQVIPLEKARGRVLRTNILADRDMPAGNLSTMDGIAVQHRSYKLGICEFKIYATQPAGTKPIAIKGIDSCVEITTGAELSPRLDTVIPYELINFNLDKKIAKIQVENIEKWQNVRRRGEELRKNESLIKAGQIIGAKELAVLATVGATKLLVSKLPKIAVISTGDELVSPHSTPRSYQIRSSNGLTISSAFQKLLIHAEEFYIPDKKTIIKDKLRQFLKDFDVVIISGGVSKGVYDFIPKVLEELGVIRLFSGVRQKPGKPFWFGKLDGGATVFALPGNPVSSMLCLHRYVMPWINVCLGARHNNEQFAILSDDVSFGSPLQYFPLVSLSYNKQGQYIAKPIRSNSSGDLVSLAKSDAFIELPARQNHYRRDTSYRVWPFNVTWG